MIVKLEADPIKASWARSQFTMNLNCLRGVAEDSKSAKLRYNLLLKQQSMFPLAYQLQEPVSVPPSLSMDPSFIDAFTTGTHHFTWPSGDQFLADYSQNPIEVELFGGGLFQ